jgi:head-tail adaptor
VSQAGKYREQISIKKPLTATTDELGGSGSTSYLEWLTWAKMELLPAKENSVNAKVTYGQPYKITVRYQEEIDHTILVVWQEKELTISSVVVDQKKTEMYLYGFRKV